jgi:hypothetical protein
MESQALFRQLLDLFVDETDSAPRTAPAVSPSAWAQSALGFTATTEQAKTLDHDAHRLILCCHRHWGKTTIVAVKALHHAIFNPGAEIAVLSRSLKQAGHLLTIVCNFAGKIGYARKRVHGHDHSLHLPNGSKIFAVANAADTARGYTADILIVDEAAFVPDPVIAAASGALANANGKLWLLSVPNGEAGLFYNVWRAKGLPGWHRVHATAAVAPFATPAFLAEQRRLFPLTFRQDFFCDFKKEQGRFISREVIEAAFRGKNVAQPHPVPSGSRIPL